MGDAATQLLESFAVFAGAFVMRPVGGVLFGYIGDKYGRVYSMRLAMSLMALPTTAIAICSSEPGLICEAKPTSTSFLVMSKRSKKK